MAVDRVVGRFPNGAGFRYTAAIPPDRTQNWTPPIINVVVINVYAAAETSERRNRSSLALENGRRQEEKGEAAAPPPLLIYSILAEYGRRARRGKSGPALLRV